MSSQPSPSPSAAAPPPPLIIRSTSTSSISSMSSSSTSASSSSPSSLQVQSEENGEVGGIDDFVWTWKETIPIDNTQVRKDALSGYLKKIANIRKTVDAFIRTYPQYKKEMYIGLNRLIKCSHPNSVIWDGSKINLKDDTARASIEDPYCLDEKIYSLHNQLRGKTIDSGILADTRLMISMLDNKQDEKEEREENLKLYDSFNFKNPDMFMRFMESEKMKPPKAPNVHFGLLSQEKLKSRIIYKRKYLLPLEVELKKLEYTRCRVCMRYYLLVRLLLSNCNHLICLGCAMMAKLATSLCPVCKDVLTHYNQLHIDSSDGQNVYHKVTTQQKI